MLENKSDYDTEQYFQREREKEGRESIDFGISWPGF